MVILLTLFYGWSCDRVSCIDGKSRLELPLLYEAIGLPLNPGACDNFCLPHASLRQPLPQPLPTHGTGSAKRWQPQTPAMAARLTDHVWTLREVLLFRVPPWPQPAGV